jgi:fructose-1,6-bisphosphatase-3
LEHNRKRIRVSDTDKGQEIGEKIRDLKNLLKAYRSGAIKES